MSQQRAQNFLFRVRDFGLLFFTMLLLIWPILQILWELGQAFEPELASALPLLGRLLEGLDAGGQSLLSRSFLRCLLSAGCVAGLLLPLPPLPCAETKWQSLPWGGSLLFFGLVSVVMSEQLFLAETEWETLALTLLFASLLRRANLKALPRLCLCAMYLVTLGVTLQALSFSASSTSGRLGGVFFHSNALSTFCLLCLPFLCWRAGRGCFEGGLASCLSAACLAILIWTGSLTGACLLFGATVFLACRQWGSLRFCLAGIAGVLPLVLNLGGFSTALFPLILLGLLLWAYMSIRTEIPVPNRVMFAVSLVVVLGSFQIVQGQDTGHGLASFRGNSGAARLEFYRAGLSMVCERPILGHGPRAYARQYPLHQESILFYSKFVHCVALELLIEWGGLGFLLASFLLLSVWRDSERSRSVGAARAFRWSMAMFFLHSLTGVQTQFPYLLIVLAVAWAATTRSEPTLPLQNLRVAAGRVALAIVLLGFLLLNCWRVSAHFSRLLAMDIHQRGGLRSQDTVRRLFASSAEMLPTCGTTWLLWARFEKQAGHPRQASILAKMARHWDSQWAIPLPYEVATSKARRDPQTVKLALGLDPVNFPSFYVWKAESMLSQGDETGALGQLREKELAYSPQLLSRLPDFRAEDLKVQLGDYFLLIAILEERHGRLSASENAFRMALHHTDQRLSRLRRLLGYTTASEIVPGPLVAELLAQVRDQVPTEDSPGTVKVSSD